MSFAGSSSLLSKESSSRANSLMAIKLFKNKALRCFDERVTGQFAIAADSEDGNLHGELFSGPLGRLPTFKKPTDDMTKAGSPVNMHAVYRASFLAHDLCLSSSIG